MAFSVCACLEPFNPEVSDSNKGFLVVDGQITDLPGPYIFQIGKSSSINGQNTRVSGVQISIEDENGNNSSLIESGNGIYETRDFQGETGKQYRLNFTYEGDQFQSSWETIEESPQIDSIYFSGEIRETTDQLIDILGVQFFVDHQGDENGARYFRYEWEETWRINVPWPSLFDYVGNDTIEAVKNPLHTCWRSDNPTGINLATTFGLRQNRLSGHKLGFITGDKERFTRRYSILIKQFTLDEAEYLFWKNLQESNEELGSLFDRQPASVTSNIKNLSDPSDIVLGYFSASGSIENRIFITPREVPIQLSRRPMCPDLDTLRKSELGDEYESMVLSALENKSFYQLLFSPIAGNEPIGVLLAAPTCADCTKRGGDLKKPDFWDE